MPQHCLNPFMHHPRRRHYHPAVFPVMREVGYGRPALPRYVPQANPRESLYLKAVFNNLVFQTYDLEACCS